ncbi:flagellar hook assembly protein FlgD [bacterium]|nr:flagellar hook assembly protein FlgD [bacterium]
MDAIDSILQPSAGNFLPTDDTILGKDDFLRILVTQLQNQDPINPLKAEEFAAQLAQFSSVEQLQNVNTNLESVMELDASLNRTINNTLATTFIGKSVTAVGDRISLKADGESVSLHYELASPSAKTVVEIRNEAGVLVRTAELSAQASGRHQFEWDGKDNSGDDLQAGTYTFSITAEGPDGSIVASTPFMVGTIDSIRYDSGNPIMTIDGLEISMGSVLEIGLGASASDLYEGEKES